MSKDMIRGGTLIVGGLVIIVGMVLTLRNPTDWMIFRVLLPSVIVGLLLIGLCVRLGTDPTHRR